MDDVLSGITADEEKKLLARANVLFKHPTWNELLVLVFCGIKAEEAAVRKKTELWSLL